MPHPRFFLRCLVLLERRLLPRAASSARYCSSGSTPTNGRPDICTAGSGRLIVRRMSRKLFGVIGRAVTGVYDDEGVRGDVVELDVSIVAGAVAARKR
jgi:hypothetical protein